MNRKERRAAKKQGRSAGNFAGASAPAAPSTQLFASAFQQFRAGQVAAAERLCRDALAIDRNHFDSLHLLGIIALQTAHHEQAIELFTRAIAANDRAPECHFNLALAWRARGHLDEAATHLRRAIALRHDYAKAHCSLADLLEQQEKFAEARQSYERALALDQKLLDAQNGLTNLLLRQGRFEEAVTRYRQMLAARPEAAEIHSNLGVALAALGQRDEAAKHYQRALALKPQLVDVYGNLGRLVLAQGDHAQALALARRGLAVAQTEESRAFFLQCAKALVSVPADRALRQDFSALITRALAEGWTRPSELAGLAAMLFRSGEAGGAALARTAAAWPRRLPQDEWCAPDDFAAIAGDPLLCALLESAPVQDIELERFLTNARSALLERALMVDAAGASTGEDIGFFCALSRQCFINEYVFARRAEELQQVAQVERMLAAALESAAPIPPLWVIAVAAYLPLNSLERADLLSQRSLSQHSLSQHSWPNPLIGLIDQQVNEPREEQRLRGTLPALTAMRDEISLAVRRQYEEMPYPRWMKAAPVGRPTTLDWYLRNQFPWAPISRRGECETLERQQLDVLIAGCGTGQHTLETARRFSGANVLAIDLSLTSLAYARRKTNELGLRNIEYAQADILELAALGRRFDLIEVSGVLHHLRDPRQGWHALVALLRPGGFMHVGLYSALARTDVRAARAFLAERGYGANADDIRRCRQEILSLQDGNPVKEVANYSDFYATSECRDLLFHVQEHQFTIAELKSLLEASGMTFIAFAGQALQDYRARFPGDQSMTDLDQWHLFELEHPKAFVNMYQFWVQRSAD
jgi:tetratricopeptide (TPR) repeat protein/2-polyprenyl-3-methyl-5-hydroxy-6-metoxy-1,4-benzoquinol methylase